jgi:hypothetical protein
MGIKDTVQAHYDLIVEIRHLLSLLPIPVTPVHIPGQGVMHCTNGNESMTPQQIPINPSNLTEKMDTHVITINHNGKAILEGLEKVIHHNVHLPVLKSKLQKDNDWMEDTLDTVAWDEYYSALRQLPRSHRISIMKLSHQLWNTNVQNNKFYGLLETCVLCNISLESIDHIYKCTHLSAITNREEAQEKLLNRIRRSTPPTLLQAIEFIIKGKLTSPELHPLAELVIQYQGDLGNSAFFRGHLSTKWREVYNESRGAATPNLATHCRWWLINFIKDIWEYSKSLWAYRNAAVHGKTSDFTESKELKQLRMDVETAYSRFSADPFYIIQSRRYPFSRPIESVTSLDRDSIRCWCKSVKEAKLTSKKREELMNKHRRSTLHHYFKKVVSQPIRGNRSKSNPLYRPAFSREYYKTNDSRSSKKTLRHGKSMSRRVIQDSFKLWCSSSRKAGLTPQPRSTQNPTRAQMAGNAQPQAIEDIVHKWRDLQPKRYRKGVVNRKITNKQSPETTLTRMRDKIKMRCLQAYGFGPVTLPVFGTSPPRPQADSNSRRVDYSGTYVSPAP